MGKHIVVYKRTAIGQLGATIGIEAEGGGSWPQTPAASPGSGWFVVGGGSMEEDPPGAFNCLHGNAVCDEHGGCTCVAQTTTPTTGTTGGGTTTTTTTTTNGTNAVTEPWQIFGYPAWQVLAVGGVAVVGLVLILNMGGSKRR